jgi:hypothetical protein
MSRHTKGKVKAKTKTSHFTAYVMRGNRQVAKLFVNASRRFMFDDQIYIIKRKAIFTAIVEGRIESICFYSEGNPNPHDFSGVNDGLEYEEFDEIYGEDLYRMLIELQRDRKTFYLILLYVMVFIMALLTLLTAIF